MGWTTHPCQPGHMTCVQTVEGSQRIEARDKEITLCLETLSACLPTLCLLPTSPSSMHLTECSFITNVCFGPSFFLLGPEQDIQVWDEALAACMSRTRWHFASSDQVLGWRFHMGLTCRPNYQFVTFSMENIHSVKTRVFIAEYSTLC